MRIEEISNWDSLRRLDLFPLLNIFQILKNERAAVSLVPAWFGLSSTQWIISNRPLKHYRWIITRKAMADIQLSGSVRRLDGFFGSIYKKMKILCIGDSIFAGSSWSSIFCFFLVVSFRSKKRNFKYWWFGGKSLISRKSKFEERWEARSLPFCGLSFISQSIFLWIYLQRFETLSASQIAPL